MKRLITRKGAHRDIEKSKERQPVTAKNTPPSHVGAKFTIMLGRNARTPQAPERNERMLKEKATCYCLEPTATSK